MTSVVLSPGKADFVKRKVGEKEWEVCLCKYNAEFSQNGCIAQVPSFLLPQTMCHKGVYAPGNWEKYKKLGIGNDRCDYCYAKRKNTGNVFPRTVDKRTEKDFETFKPEIIRIGKTTDGGHPVYYPTQIAFFKLCARQNPKTAVIFTTKLFPFGLEGALETAEKDSSGNVANLALGSMMISGKGFAQMLKEINGSLLYSIGYDKMERGIVSQGFTNQWRIAQAVRYHQEGVNTSLTIVCDVTQSVQGNVEHGSSVGLALEAHRKHGINVRVLPIRLNSNDVALKVTGKNLQELKDSGKHSTRDLLRLASAHVSDCSAPYSGRGNNEAYPLVIHPDFRELISSGTGVCGRIGDTEYCDKCNLRGTERENFPASEMPKVEYDYKTIRRPTESQKIERAHPALFDLKKKNGKGDNPGLAMKRNTLFDKLKTQEKPTPQ